MDVSKVLLTVTVGSTVHGIAPKAAQPNVGAKRPARGPLE